MLAIIPLGLFAQDSTNILVGKKGIAILPQAGDFAIGIDAVPYINFLGNALSSGGNNLNLNNSNTLYGKYYLDQNTAIRAELYSYHLNETFRNYVTDDAAVYNDPNSMAQVVDILKMQTHSYGIGVGIQKYRGYGRLRGTYGGQISYLRSKSQSDYTWGNAMNALNPSPTSTFWSTTGDFRYLNLNNEASNTVAIGALAGIEYFFLPKICIGGEVGLSYTYGWSKQSNYTYEEVQDLSGTPTRVEIERMLSPGDSYSAIQTWLYGAPAGRIYVLFHF